MELLHGGDWAGYLREYGAMPLDFSVNISPLGLPEGVKKAVTEALEISDRYPDPLCQALRETLSQQLGVPASQILCGNGAADLIFRLVLARQPKKAIVTAPTFQEYEQALRMTDCVVERFYLRDDEGFAVTRTLLSRLGPHVDMLFLCEPNNPSGVTTDRALLKEILQRCMENGTLLVVDECFNAFLDQPESHSLIGEVSMHPNLFILRAFTKWYAMAGLRLGYCLCKDEDLLEQMRQCGQPWVVSTLAQAAGVAALEETDYSQRLRVLISDERPRLEEQLQTLGCHVVSGEANYLLFFHGDGDLAEKLRQRGILIRDCSNYQGLSKGWYRVAVRTREENDVLLKTMEAIL